MGSWRLVIHVCSPNSSVAESQLHVFLHDFSIVNFDLGEILYKYALIWTFLKLHPCLDIFPQKVMDLFIIYFDEAAANKMGFGCVTFGDGHNLAKCSRDDALAFFRASTHHGVSFPAARLPICEDSAVITVENIIYKWESALLIDQGLRRIGRKYKIIRKVLRRLSSLWFC